MKAQVILPKEQLPKIHSSEAKHFYTLDLEDEAVMGKLIHHPQIKKEYDAGYCLQLHLVYEPYYFGPEVEAVSEVALEGIYMQLDDGNFLDLTDEPVFAEGCMIYKALEHDCLQWAAS